MALQSAHTHWRACEYDGHRVTDKLHSRFGFRYAKCVVALVGVKFLMLLLLSKRATALPGRAPRAQEPLSIKQVSLCLQDQLPAALTAVDAVA